MPERAPSEERGDSPFERRAVLALFWSHRRAFARASLLGLGLLAGQLLALAALEPLFSALAAGRSPADALLAWKTGGALTAALVLLALLRWRLPTLQAQAEEAFVADLQGRVVAGLLARPSSFWAKASVGELSLQLTEDIRAALSYARALYQSSWLVPLRVAALFALLWWVAPALALPAVVAIPLVAASLIVVGRGLSEVAERGREARAGHAGALSRLLVSAELFQAYDVRRQVVADLASRLHLVFLEGARLSRLSGLGVQLADLLRLVGIVAVLLWGQGRVAAGALVWSDLLSSVPILFLLYGPLVDLVRLAPRMAEGRSGARRILPLLGADARREAKAMPNFSRSLSLDRVCFSYVAGQPVLEEASLILYPREWVALVGPSGAGKTTLLKLILGLEQAQEGGRFLVDGRDVTSAVYLELRPLCALVTQDPILPERTVRGNLLLADPGASDEALWDALEAVALAQRVGGNPRGLDLDVGERGGALSGGERERLALARALLSPAPVLLLDEPTAFLDPATREKLLDRLGRERNRRALLVVSHAPELIEAADRVYVLRQGQLHEEPRRVPGRVLGGGG